MKIRIFRILAFLVDLILSAIVAILLDLIFVKTEIFDETIAFSAIIIAFHLRDLFQANGSPGKIILGLKLTFKKKSIVIRILRNTSNILWPIEGMILLIFGRRISDMILNANVVFDSKSDFD